MGYTFTVNPHDDDHNIVTRRGNDSTVPRSVSWVLSDDDVLALDDAVSARATAIRQARLEASNPARPGPAPDREYRVTWVIDVHADNPRDAAEQARAAQVRPGTTATVFQVFQEWGRHSQQPPRLVEIDLLDPPE
jgi:hypothetical protein